MPKRIAVAAQALIDFQREHYAPGPAELFALFVLRLGTSCMRRLFAAAGASADWRLPDLGPRACETSWVHAEMAGQ